MYLFVVYFDGSGEKVKGQLAEMGSPLPSGSNPDHQPEQQAVLPAEPSDHLYISSVCLCPVCPHFCEERPEADTEVDNAIALGLFIFRTGSILLKLG